MGAFLDARRSPSTVAGPCAVQRARRPRLFGDARVRDPVCLCPWLTSTCGIVIEIVTHMRE